MAVDAVLVLAQTSITDAAKQVVIDMINSLPGVLAAIIIILVGYLVGSILGTATNRIVDRLVERPLSNTEIGRKYREYGIDLSDFTGGAVKAFVLVIAIMIALPYLNVTGAAYDVLTSIVYYLPRLIGGIVVIFYGTILAGVLSSFIGMGLSEGVESNQKVANMVRATVFIGLLAVVITIALNLLGLGGNMVYTLILGIVIIGIGVLITDTLVESLEAHADFQPYAGYAKFLLYTVFIMTGLAAIFALYPGATAVLTRLAWGIAIAFAIILIPLVYSLAKKMSK